MTNNEDIKWLYGKLKGQGYDIGTEEEFTSSLSNSDDRDWYYNKAIKMGLDVGSKDEFDSLFAPQVSTPEAKVTQTPQAPQAPTAPTTPKVGSLNWYTAKNAGDAVKNVANSSALASATKAKNTEATDNLAKVKGTADVAQNTQELIHTTPIESKALELAQFKAKNKAMFDSMAKRTADMGEYYTKAGADVGKVVETAPQYNAETGEFDTQYITPTLNREDNKAIADAEAREYKQMLKDVAIYNKYFTETNMTTAAQLRSKRARLADVERKISERIESLQAEQEKLSGGVMGFINELGRGSAGRGIAKGVYTQDDETAFALDEEYKTLRAIKSQLEEQIQKLENKQDNEQNGTQPVFDFLKGASQNLFAKNTFDFGRNSLNDSRASLNISDKITRGEELTDTEEQLIYEQFANQLADEYIGNLGKGLQYGHMTGDIAGFAIDMALMGPSGSGGGAIAKGLTNAIAKRLGVKTTEGLAKKLVERGLFATIKNKGAVGKLLSEVGIANTSAITATRALGIGAEYLAIKSPIMTVTQQGQKAAAKIIDTKLGDVELDYYTGELRYANDKGFGEATYEALGDQIIENASEMIGGHLPGISNVTRLGSRGLTASVLRATREGAGTVISKVNQFLGKVGVHSVFDEISEEYIGQAWRTIFRLESAKGQDGNNNLLNAEFHSDIWCGMGASIGFMHGIGLTVGYGAKGVSKVMSGVEYQRLKHQVNKASAYASSIIPAEQWDNLQTLIDAADNVDISNVAEQIAQNKDLTDRQKDAAMNYINRLMIMRGFNLAKVFTDKAGVTMDADAEAVNQSYADGYESNDAQEMADARKAVEIEEAKLRSALSGIDQEGINAIMADVVADPVTAMQRAEDEALRDAIADYANAKAVYDGMQQRVADDIDTQIAVSDATIDRRTNRNTGKIQSVTLKNDKKVYVVGGTLNATENGSVDFEHSDESIIVMDETGALEYSSPKNVLSIDNEIDPVEEKTISAEAIRQQAQAQAEANMSGKLTFTAGEQVQLKQEDGTFLNGTIVGPYIEDGKVISGLFEVETQDGIKLPFKTDVLQTWADEARQARVEQFDADRSAEREQTRQVEQASEVVTEETAAPVEETPTEPQTSALERVPTDEQGNPIYEQVDAETAWDAIVEQTEGDVAMAQTVANDMVKDKEKALKAAQNAKSKGGATIAEKIASEQERKANIQNAEQELAIWQSIASVPEARQQAMAKAQAQAEAERIKAEEAEVQKPTLLDVVRTLYSKGKDVASKLFQRSFFDVAETPKFMQELGLRGDKFTIKYGVIARHLGKDSSHTLTERDWEQLPQALQNPFAISKLTDKTDSYRIYTTLQTESGEFVVVGADVKNAGREIEVNAVSTVFGRRNNANLPKNEEVIYRSKEITPEQSSLLERPNFAQYPTEQELSISKDTTSSQNNNEIEGENVHSTIGEQVQVAEAEVNSNLAEAHIKAETPTISQESEQVSDQDNAPYTIAPSQYTTKKGKVLDMHLVKFAGTLTKEQQRAAKELAKADKGWYDREQGGFMMRSEESAKQLAETILNNDDAVDDAQPVSLSDTREVVEEYKPNEEPTTGANQGQFGLVSDERMADLKARLRNKLGQLNAGIDPEVLAIGLEIAVGHLDRGIKSFADFAKVMIEDLGDVVRPYLKAFYNGARDLPEVIDNGLSDGMTSYDEVRIFDVANFGKSSVDTFDTARIVVAEQNHQEEAEQAKQEIIKKRNIQRKERDEQTTANTQIVASEAAIIASEATSGIEEATTEEEVNAIEQEVDKQLVAIDNQLSELDYIDNLHSGMRVITNDGRNILLNMVMHEGEQLSVTQFSTPRVRRMYGVSKGELVDIAPSDVDVEATMRLNEGSFESAKQMKQKIDSYNGYKIGDKVIYTPQSGKREPVEATIHEFEDYGEHKPVLDTGMAPVLYEVVEWNDIAPISEEKTEKAKKSSEKSVTSQQSDMQSLFDSIFDNQTEKENETERRKDSRTDNSRTRLGSEELSETESVGTRTSVQGASRNSQSKRRRSDLGSGEFGNRPQYDVNKNYTNEEIGEIVSSVTDIVDGKVVITGAVSDDIKAVCRQYRSGGVAKKGRGILDEYYTDGKIVDVVGMLIAPYFKGSKAVRVLEPSVGVGNFIAATRDILISQVVTFEINETTARIAKVLYPDIDVNLRSFETEFIDESGNKKPMPQKYSLVIGNPPYGSHRGLYKGLGEESKIARYEDYFVKRSLDVLEEGGVLAMVLPSSWIDRHTKFGGYTIEAAYRLPSGAFEATQVGTDIVVLRKDSSIPVSEHTPYFEQHPERVLGEVKQRKGRFGKMEDYVEGNIDAAIEAIEREHAKGLAEELNITPSNDNLNDIQSAIEETGSTEKAKAIVESEQKSSEQAKKSTTSTESKPSKYKVALSRDVETVPTSNQFEHKFSEGEVEAFANTDYDGTITNPSRHRKYANYMGGRMIHDFYYAEGDIYTKLVQLEREKDYIIETYGQEQYEKQKRLLEGVLPKRKGLDEITISPNTTFVKNLKVITDGGRTALSEIFIDFCRKLPYSAFGDSSLWEVIGYVKNEQVYGQDKERNQLVRERRKRVANDLFVKFLDEELSDEAKAQVVMAFNREYNSTYRPDYSKVPMFSTINRDFRGKPLKLTEVQLAGIGRMTVKGVGVLAHEVGFGKTLSGILAMHEAMTRGFARKPLIVVPNDNILKQWVETINEVLPSAMVNMLGNLGTSYNLTDFKVNDGEITIVTYEGLKAMSFSDDTYNRLAERFSYITEDLAKHQSERDIQIEIEKKKELKGKMKRGTKPTYRFEDFGFDWLTFDEVHNANHIVSKVRLDKSISSDFRSQSQRTSDLGLKTWLAAQYIQELNDGRNVLLLSATPFTNKPLEYYSILSLVANDMLRKKGFFNVDQFFATFMEADNELEVGANGRPVQKTNIRRFRNNGLFQQLLSEFIDIKGEEDNPDLVRPTRHNREYKIAQNELTEEAIAASQDLLSDNETVLQGISHARAAAFSPYATYLLGIKPKNAREFVKNSPKIDAAIKLIEQNKKDRPDAGQIIYSEVGVEFFPMIRDYLVSESGFKADEVRIITGATSNAERIKIQTEFNKGGIKVVIGSPAIKEGLNLQENTTDMYILSLPWNFTQLRQIEGRGWRQGNKWENIRINYLLTNDSVDVFMLQRLQLKQGLYNEAMKSGAESLDVSDIDTSELKTALITDPAVRAEIVTVQQKAKLQQEKTQIEADLSFVNRKYESYNKVIEKLNEQKKSINLFRGYAKDGSDYWANIVKREEAALLKIEEEIQQEREKLLKKGVNVDEIERQTKQAQDAIDAIQNKIDNLEEFQKELTEKYRQESEAKAAEINDKLSDYIKERKTENTGGFYKIRPKEGEQRANTEEDDDVLYRSDDATKNRIEALFNQAISGEFKGKPISIGTLTDEGKAYLEQISGIAFKGKVDFVLNPSDLIHIYKRHFGENEKDGRNIPLDIEDIRSIVDIISNPDRVIYSVEEGQQERKMFSFLKEVEQGTYNLLEIYSDRKGNLTAKSFYKSKEGVSQRVISLTRTLHSTSETDGATLNDGAKIPQMFETPSVEDNYSRSGEGAVSDEGVTMASDPVSKVIGEPRYGRGKKMREYAERQRRFMVQKVQEIAQKLKLDNVEIVTDASTLSGKRAKAKGYFNPTTGKIVIVIPNHASVLDVEETVLHEAVAHYGLRKLFGKHFDTFLDNVYESADPEIRKKIAALAAKNGWDFRKATEEYLAMLAEDTEFESVTYTGWWFKVKELFRKMLDKLGLEGFAKEGLTLSDNELRYILFRSYQHLQGHRGLMFEAEDAVKQYELGVGNYSAPKVAESGEEGDYYRDGDFTPRDRVMARDHYERVVSSGSYQFREAVQDSMLGLRRLMESILPKTKIEEIAGSENAYIFENRMSSTNAGEQHVYFTRYMKPLLEEIGRICRASKVKREALTEYLMAKHGLERNEYMRKKAEEKEEDTERDFAGLTGLTGEADWQRAEEVARQIVEDFEVAHNTDSLWEAINNATKATLEKLYMSGILSKEQYEEVSNMYSYYIPLRGWDETTSDEVYGYLTSKDGPLGSVMKKAKGRSTVADDPIATIALMADDAIRQGNRNLMKVRFLNFVLNHPSDLVSVKPLWLQYNEAKDEWEPIYPELTSDMTPEEVELEVEAFEERMKQLSEESPDKYKHGRDAVSIPYKVINDHLSEHQVIVKRNGRTFILTINGNPRAAQAINGLTNPDVQGGGLADKLAKWGTALIRELSALYTTRNPDFVISNFMRDMIYTNSMVWAKESPEYALHFHANCIRVNATRMAKLFAKWELGTLGNSGIEGLFYQFMTNGGETGYTEIKNLDRHKKDIAAEIKKQRNVGRKVWSLLGTTFEIFNRSVENMARFSAFVTSIEMGRSVDRAIYDAKEISVNFNKKGAGSKMWDATGQTKLGKLGSFIGGSGRIWYVFFNAGVQGMANFGRTYKKHPIKMTVGTMSLLLLGYLVPMLIDAEDDDDSKNAYYNLPEYIRRTNICMPVGDSWITIPLPIEYRALYGLGEMAYGVLSGKEHYNNEELAYNIAAQFSQVFPIDMLEGNRSMRNLIPSYVQPIYDVNINESWTGVPISKQTPFNEFEPEWQKAYQSTDIYLVDATRWLNEVSGGNAHKKGAIDINPADIEYLLSSYLGGVYTFPSKALKSGETAFGDREFEWRNIPLANRLVKQGDERTAQRKLKNQYFNYGKEDFEVMSNEVRGFTKDAARGDSAAAEHLKQLSETPEYKRWLIYKAYKPHMTELNKLIKETPMSDDSVKMYENLYYEKMREVVNGLNDPEAFMENLKEREEE